MAYSDKEIKNIFNAICTDIVKSKSLRKALIKNDLSNTTWFKWITEDEKKKEQYAYACEMREEFLFDEILDIADDGSNDWMEILDKDGENVGWKINGEHVQRSRVRIDSRKWMLGKMRPTKYGDRTLNENKNINLNADVELTKEQVKDISDKLDDDV